MGFNITFKKSVFKDLKRLSKSEAKIILDKIDTEISKKTDIHPQLRGRFKSLRKFRVGNYRVIYTIFDNNILILRIVHRKDAYKDKK